LETRKRAKERKKGLLSARLGGGNAILENAARQRVGGGHLPFGGGKKGISPKLGPIWKKEAPGEKNYP